MPEPLLDEAELRGERAVSAAFDLINDNAVQAYRCGACRRLMVFAEGRGTTPVFYFREQD